MVPQQEKIDFYGRVLCMPLALLISFSMFQYLLTMYYKRWKEFYGMLLLSCGFGAFTSLIPFAHENDTVVNDLNDISETLSVMTFLVQITMIGHDINKKIRIRSLKWLTRAADVLILFCVTVSLKDAVELALPRSKIASVNAWDNYLEEAALWFIFCFRFYFIAMTKGMRAIFETKKLEVAVYMLFVTHEYPFQLLNAYTNVNWEEVQALWHRVTMALCLLHTIRTKLRSRSSKGLNGDTAASRQPSISQFKASSAKDVPKLAELGPSTKHLKKNSRSVVPHQGSFIITAKK